MRLLAIVALVVGLSSLARAEYTGVVPGSKTVPEKLPTAGEGALVSWPGFQMTPSGGSRVFIQTTVAVVPELKRVGENWQVTLPGVALPPGNTRRPLDTQFFNTPVRSVRTQSRGDAVVVTVTMRAKLQPIVRTERAENGYFFTYLEFPAGQFL